MAVALTPVLLMEGFCFGMDCLGLILHIARPTGHASLLSLNA